MKVKDLCPGQCCLKLSFRNGEKKRVEGVVIISKNGEKNLVVHSSPEKSYGPGTKVDWCKRR